jgi:hypothetical protein
VSRPQIPRGYLVSFFDAGTDAKLAAHVAMPGLPVPGTLVIFPGGVQAWEVTGAEVLLFDPDSWQADDGYPLYADVAVKRGRGVHTGTPEDEGT